MPEGLGAVLAGLALGLGLIMPIGAQNSFILQQGLTLGYPRVLYATLTTTCCDALMIGAGALGLSTLLGREASLKIAMMFVGGGLLTWLTVQGIRAANVVTLDAQANVMNRWRTIGKAMAVSLLNPHAVLDTVGVLGAVALTHHGAGRLWFAVGAVLASLIWFSVLGASASVIRSKLSPRVTRNIALLSACVMAVFAVLLVGEAIRETVAYLIVV